MIVPTAFNIEPISYLTIRGIYQGPHAHLRGDFEADIRLHRCHMLLGNADGYLQVFGKFHFDSLVSPLVMKKTVTKSEFVKRHRLYGYPIKINMSETIS